MKHLENNAYELEALKEALELSETPRAVEQKLREVYAELPDELPRRRRSPARLLKAAAGTAAGLAAAFLLMFGMNTMSPAFAESLPLIGGIFQRINNRQGWLNQTATQLSVQKYAQPVEGVSVEVPAGGIMEKPMNVSVRETYFDGMFLYVGMELEISENSDTLFPGLDSSYDVLLNGESQSYYEEGKGWQVREGFASLSEPCWEKIGDGSYISQQAYCVPENCQDLDQLEVTLKCGRIYSTRDFLDFTVNSTPFELNFTARKNGVQPKRIDGNGLEMGGIKLISAAASPAGTQFVMEYPDTFNNPAVSVRFEDGGNLGMGYYCPDRDLGNGMIRSTDVCGGFREDETRRVVYTLFDKNDSDQFEAVFLLDFTNGTAELGTAEDVVTFTGAMYECGWEALKEFTGNYKISLASWKNGGNELLLFVSTTDESPKGIRTEIYQSGELIGSRETLEQNMDQFKEQHYREIGPDGNSIQHETGRNRYALGILGMENLDPDQDVTVKLYDARSNELLDEETITLTPDK